MQNSLEKSFQRFLESLPPNEQNGNLAVTSSFSFNQEEEVLKRVENSPLKLVGLLK